MTPEREDGWYWVRWRIGRPLAAWRWENPKGWHDGYDLHVVGLPVEIGPRIPFPDEHKPAAPEPAPIPLTYHCICGHTQPAHHSDGECMFCKCDGYKPLIRPPQHSQPCPVTVEELRKRAQLIRTGWTFYEAPQIAAELDELADWLGGQQQ